MAWLAQEGSVLPVPQADYACVEEAVAKGEEFERRIRTLLHDEVPSLAAVYAMIDSVGDLAVVVGDVRLLEVSLRHCVVPQLVHPGWRGG